LPVGTELGDEGVLGILRLSSHAGKVGGLGVSRDKGFTVVIHGDGAGGIEAAAAQIDRIDEGDLRIYHQHPASMDSNVTNTGQINFSSTSICPRFAITSRCR
jgi:hypothetical protein